MSAKEIRKIIDICKKRCEEDLRDECRGCLWFDKDTGDRHCTINKSEEKNMNWNSVKDGIAITPRLNADGTLFVEN